jgi:hypothetical protein
MHPEILRELTAQHGRDMRERAHWAQLARTARRTKRAMRRGTDSGDGFVVPPIPDYVDGSFRTAGDETASQVPAGRRAA